MKDKVLKESAIIIKYFEGFRSSVYKCSAGIDTIGYGTTFYPDGTKVTRRDKPITEQVADEYLNNHLDKLYDKIFGKIVTNDELEINHMVVIMSFTYNLGIGKLKNSTLLVKINANMLEHVPRELAKWVYQGGKVTRGLVTRRNMEIRIWNS